MTKQQFIDYVAEFKKNPGEFTRDEIYEIGLRHKTLPQNEKSWEWVKEIVGWQGSKESLRGYINHRDSYVNPNDPDLNGLDGDTTTTVDTYRQQIEDLYKEKTKIRDYKNAYHRSLRAEARIEEIKQLIKEEIPNLPKLSTIRYSGVNYEADPLVEAIIPVGDLHLGSTFKNSYNEYSVEIATSRLETLLNKTIEYCKKHKVQKLNVINMGDMISGKIHPTIRIQNSIDAVSQTMKAAELLAHFVNELQKVVPQVTYRTVSDNHSRIEDDKSQHLESENLNRIIDWFVEERLKNTDVRFLHDNLDIGVGRFVLNNGKKVFFMHGHEDRKSSVMQDMVGLSREFPDYILMAHYHNSAEHTFQGSKVYISGSIMGTDSYAYSHRLFSDPEQKLLIFEGKDIVSVEIKL